MAVFVMNSKKFPTWLLVTISLLPFAFALTVVYSAVYTKLMITTWRLRKNDAAELAKEKFAHWAMYSLLYTVLLCFMFYQMILELKNFTLP